MQITNDTVVLIGQAVLGAALGWIAQVLRGIRADLNEIGCQLQTLNGRVTRAEQQLADQERLCEVRHSPASPRER